MIKAYGFRCLKCGDVVDDTQAPFLVYAERLAGAFGAEDLLQGAIKEHDVSDHPDDGQWPDFEILVMYTRKARKRKRT